MSDLTTDQIWPRNAEHRYRLYAAKGEELRIVAASPDLAGIGGALATALEEHELRDERVGVMDTFGGSGPGAWLANPFA